MINDVVLVDAQDVQVGVCDKRDAHLGAGQLHRAFSVHLIDSQGRHLLQRRAAGKMLWPGFWSNACCSHPAPGESILDAASRRLREELDVRSSCRALYSFEYHASFGSIGAEHELCHVLVAQSDAVVSPMPEEVSEIMWLTRAEISARLAEPHAQFTPWFRMQWRRLLLEHSSFDTPSRHL
ncbi:MULTISPECIES: isopentenyl-diphosphate Delta-isomerase [Pseudomonas]|uniref:Isopentenyl-diphosphate Delta-isomerase n=1 Tax=Pseudomonas fluorescens TaxID=294 RepID=A0A2N1E1U1_PSEFL|nr:MULTISPECIES: isopentenyl-diphosphate Delta-isomerase [Pseudomonas]MBD8100465.1 isopentenyl-diphosphate Delta-isomerase [Pseudomonas fluorescens]MBD8782107.1 isopentenyl-diphosphate Delta-isomerase [Pseudomonas fluorescens]MBD8794681.1 isopentenyl-diphosphate Delta-isomerase [Pseudomonas fluorescens]PKH18373.1 isopentenyl-diphosphate Delta-isomerase [Pseudomonas fluorescens]CRM80303.1 Isopentenyl-diphosphate Delta-isomerase [Pseudomonas sp. 37 R 15]